MSKTPLYIAPNLLTIVGLCVNIVTSLLLFGYSPNAKNEAPAWCYLACSVGLFVYQSLDAIGRCAHSPSDKILIALISDGKQARRTNTSSPLGELFDHG